MTSPLNREEDSLGELLKEHIEFTGDGWWHPKHGYNELKEALLQWRDQYAQQAAIEARIDELKITTELISKK